MSLLPNLRQGPAQTVPAVRDRQQHSFQYYVLFRRPVEIIPVRGVDPRRDLARLGQVAGRVYRGVRIRAVGQSAVTQQDRSTHWSRRAHCESTGSARCEDGWRQWFASTGIQPCQVLYEELSRDRLAVVNRVLEFLRLRQLDADTLPPVRYRKQADSLTERYADLVRSAMSSPGCH